jgi:benzoyl-CoA reductase/2-hydroxyglutaryl-CoA dehydratase subunit BcrC/BadD/HgdB
MDVADIIVRNGTEPAMRDRAFILFRDDTEMLQERTSLWKQMVRDYRAEGVLFHNNRSCHTFSRLQGQIADALKKEFGEGFKAIVFDGDMGLEERFQKHRFFTAIETFFSGS